MANEQLNLSAMRKLMEENAKEAEERGETAVVGSDWMNQTKEVSTEPVVEPKDEVKVTYEKEEASYEGPGLVVEDYDDGSAPQTVEFTGIAPSTMEDVEAYLDNMEDEFTELKSIYKGDTESDEDSESSEDDETEEIDEDTFNENYKEAVIYIDKTGMGSVIDFTDEERAKLEHVNTIKINEIETIDISVLKTKKTKKKDFDKIIKNINSPYVTPVCLPLSGYTARIKGCSAYELMSLIENGNNALLDAQTKWSLIHSKIESTSIGDMDYNTFLMNTAASDYNNLIYGILCATYPNNDSIPYTCPKCKTEYIHEYSVKSLIRAEKMNDSLKDQFMKVVDASVNERDASDLHDNSPITKVTTIKLPSSGIIVEVQVQSAYDLINNSIKGLSNNKDAKYAQAAILSTLVKTIYMEDTEANDGSYFEITDAMEIAQVIYRLNERDILIMKKFGDELMGGMTVEYGFMSMKCPKCGHFIPSLPVEPDNLLFHRYRQALNTNID